ncbi:MAG: sugar phosphate isomerase/epimerase [Edaphobacter sp.]|uniref:sugar phosphate isomerase/epimerase family protein n=1 Tax=Edaphobacter sp. TaxID=1934404 RepID=UPI00238A28E5|nr:sugar phosphate isomerase/epimerase family protein [Edaphobacter sp.]MDE1177948.1 sugar phosphate isomerase/epimerase [Edaphobacter sp.]
MAVTRRSFLGGAAAVAASMSTRFSFGMPFGLQPGIQLYSVRQQMAEDFEGALAAVREAGFVQVESASLPKKPAKEIRAALDKAGLKCVSSHRSFVDVTKNLDETIEFEKTMGVSYIICPGPGRKNPPAPGTKAGPLTIEDWQYNAESFNTTGAKLKSEGITFGYHNHWLEFEPVDGKVPYEELLRICDPSKTTFELDCGWAMVAGHNPAELFKKYPHRFSMLHVKDFKLPSNPSPANHEEAKVTELGRGSIDYKPIFAAAGKNQKITHAFVEQEAFDIPWKESLKVDADYLKAL